MGKNTIYAKEAGILLDYLLNSKEMAEYQGIEKGIPLSKSARDTLDKSGMLEGIQFEASQKMEGCNFAQLAPVLENGSFIDDFFAACNDYIYEKATLEEATKSLVSKLSKNYF